MNIKNFILEFILEKNQTFGKNFFSPFKPYLFIFILKIYYIYLKNMLYIFEFKMFNKIL